MGFFSIGYRKSKEYNYKAMYYDKEKDELKKRIRRAKLDDVSNDSEEEESSFHKFKGRFSDYSNLKKKPRTGFEKIRLLIVLLSVVMIIIILYLVSYLTIYIINNV